ncbi:hypothetical protein SK128_006029 [Halocaridina rubra]|uniref:Uncharacterized protein n=1 Tax=Halocaridina rubra TaxID=373956 RepID=A0AAN8WIX1_HALRR
MTAKILCLLILGVCFAWAQRDLSQFRPIGQTRPVIGGGGGGFQTRPFQRPQVQPSPFGGRFGRSADPNSPVPPPGYVVGERPGAQTRPFQRPQVQPSPIAGRFSRSADPNSPVPPPGYVVGERLGTQTGPFQRPQVAPRPLPFPARVYN